MNIGHIFDIVIVICFLVGIVRGWFIGLAVKVGHVIALVAACIAAHIAGTFLGAFLSEGLILPYFEKHSDGIISVQIVKKGASVFANQVSYDIIFLVTFIIALLVFNHLVHILKIVDRIPVVGTLNKFGGALLGFVTEFIIVYIICAVLFSFLPQSTFDGIGLTQPIINETYFLHFFAR